MPIQNDQELAAAVQQAGNLLQEIADYTGHRTVPDAKVRFPRGVIRTAHHFRIQLPGYVPNPQRSSCAYGLMFTDVIWWLCNRTDIESVAKEMALKSVIITMGSVLEAVLQIPGEGIFDIGSAAGVKARLDRAHVRHWVTAADLATLKQLWDDRCNVHTRLLAANEFGFYHVPRVMSEMAALKRLLPALKAWHDASA